MAGVWIAKEPNTINDERAETFLKSRMLDNLKSAIEELATIQSSIAQLQNLMSKLNGNEAE